MIELHAVLDYNTEPALGWQEVVVNTPRILLVEDDENVAFVTRETLAGSGAYVVERAASLGAARLLLRTQRFDLVLMDYNLPDGTGLQLVQELGADMPVVMVTGRGDERVATETLMAGAVDYVVKAGDYLARELPDKIDRALQQWQLKRAVARAESRYRSIFDEASDGILVCDINGVVLEANQHACRWLQLERPALVGQRIQDLEQPAHPLLRAEVAERLDLAGEAVYEAFFRRADGTSFPVEVSVQRVVHTEQSLLQYFVRDTTQRKQIEEQQLARQREVSALGQLTAAINRSLELPEVLEAALNELLGALQVDCGAIYLERDNGLYLSAAHGFSAEFRGSAARYPQAADAVATAAALPAPMLPWLAAEQVQAALAETLAAPSGPVGVLLLGDRRRQTFSADESNFVRVTCDRIAGAIENARLLQRLQASVEATRTAQAQLMQAARLSAIGQMAAGVAHQISNPLTTVIADSQLLLRAVAPDHPAHASALAIQHAGWRAQRVVQRLLNYSRPGEEVMRPTRVAGTVGDALDLVRSYLQRSGVQLELQLDAELTPVMAIESQLEEIWINLLMNARDALVDTKAPRVTVAARCTPDGRSVEVEISDNGPGISFADQAAIFEPFYTTKADRGGTGLGLSVCQTIAQRHGGYITVQSSEGAGAAFLTHLPFAPA